MAISLFPRRVLSAILLTALLTALAGLLWAADPPKSSEQNGTPDSVKAGEENTQKPAARSKKAKAGKAEKKAKKTDADGNGFARVVRDDKKTPIALETAIVRYAVKGQADSPTVDLVAAVHIGEADYYKALSKEFADYDAVLYELVAPEEASRPARDQKSQSALSTLQNGIKDMLGLEFQLKGIDYTAKNMVHADMSPEQFSKSMADHGESILGMIARMMGYAMTQEGADERANAQLLDVLLAKDRTLALRRMAAEQLALNDGATAALEGPKGSTLVSGRNKVALDVLKKELAGGKKKIAIFYGAAHMPDFQKHLASDFNMTPTNTRWLTAWDMKEKVKETVKEKAKEKPAK